MEPLSQSFYRRDTRTVARELLGTYLIRLASPLKAGSGQRSPEPLAAGRIVETEAYRQDDPASHSYRGKTRRTEMMFEAGGWAYVYLIYGMYYCFNVVSETEGYGGAVLVRAIEPVYGLGTMWHSRFPTKPVPLELAADAPGGLKLLRSLGSGPGILAGALGISRERDNGKSLSESDLVVTSTFLEHEARNTDGLDIEATTRIGITKGAERDWRYVIRNNPYLSRPPRRIIS